LTALLTPNFKNGFADMTFPIGKAARASGNLRILPLACLMAGL
jgi:hypothetical protein